MYGIRTKLREDRERNRGDREQIRRKIRFFNNVVAFPSQTDILLRIYKQKRMIAVTFCLNLENYENYAHIWK